MQCVPGWLTDGKSACCVGGNNLDDRQLSTQKLALIPPDIREAETDRHGRNKASQEDPLDTKKTGYLQKAQPFTVTRMMVRSIFQRSDLGR